MILTLPTKPHPYLGLVSELLMGRKLKTSVQESEVNFTSQCLCRNSRKRTNSKRRNVVMTGTTEHMT